MAKDNSVLVNALYPTVEKTISNKEAQNKLVRNISLYFDKNSEIIFDIGMAQRIFFLNTDKEAIYEASGLTQAEIKTAIKNSKYISNTWKILNEPLNTAAALLIRYFAINKKKELLEQTLLFYSFYFYSSLHFKYLQYGANENIMAYTINNLNYKFKIKELGSLFEAVKAIVLKSHDTYEKDLIRGEDGDIAKYVSAIKVRLNDMVKNIKNEYTQNYNQKNYLNADKDNYDEDNYHEADNTSYSVKRISDASLMRLMTYGPDMQLANLASQLSQVSQNEIRSVIMSLSNEDSDKILRLSELIIQLFLNEPGNRVEDVRTKKFLSHCLEIYKKSNTNDKIILEIKQILDYWLGKHSMKYRKTNREATLSNFRRAIFLYFVLHIQTNAR